MSNSISVLVPGSTSNLGSGFDTLGMAVNLYNRITVTRRDGRGVYVVSVLQDPHLCRARAMLDQAAHLFFSRANKPPFAVEFSLTGDVPFGRGLGASATARLGLLLALNQLSLANLNPQQLLELGTELEGHPDNVSPALFGGFTVSGQVGGVVRCLNFPVDAGLKLITLIPNLEISTEAARKLVPSSFSKIDTAHSLNRTALITAAFVARNYAQLKGLFDDRFHQPYRQQLIPKLSAVVRAAEAAGAIGGWLSGSGSAIMCVTMRNPAGVATAMQCEWPDSDVKILVADNEGARIAGDAYSKIDSHKPAS